MFSKLIVTSPNGGATVALRDGNKDVVCIDSFNATGLGLRDDLLVRALQPRYVVICHLGTGEHTFISGGGESGARFGDVHDVLIESNGILLVSTETNAIDCFGFDGAPTWTMSYPGEHDSHHFNSLVRMNGKLLVSRFGNFTQSGAYRSNTRNAGYVEIVGENAVAVSGLSQPHSLVVDEDRLLLANSEQFEIREYSGKFELNRKKNLGGYTRGIFVRNDIVYVGISGNRKDLQAPKKASIVALDRASWEEVGRYELYGVSEIYSILGFEESRPFEAAVSCMKSASEMLTNSGEVVWNGDRA